MLCCALFLLFSAANASAAGPTYVSTDITTDTHWTEANSPYVVINNITVADGKTLTIDAGVVVKVNYETQITVNGTLVVAGQANKMVNMTTNNTAVFWSGILGNTNSNLNLDHLYFNNATGIYSMNNVFVNNSRFIDVSYEAVNVYLENKSGAVTIMNSYFRDAGLVDPVINVYVLDHAEGSWALSYSVPINIKNNLFDGGQIGDVVVVECLLSGEGSSSIAVDSDFTFSGNVFNNTYAGSHDGLDYIRMFYAYDNATESFTGDVLVKDNVFDDLFYAVDFQNVVTMPEDYKATVTVNSDVTLVNNEYGSNVDYDLYMNYGVTAYGSNKMTVEGTSLIDGNVFNATGRCVTITRSTTTLFNSTVVFNTDYVIQNNIFEAADSGDAILFGNMITASGNWASNSTTVFNGGLLVTDNVADNVDDQFVDVILTASDFVGNGTVSMNVPITVENNELGDIGTAVLMLGSSSFAALDNTTVTVNAPIVVRNNNVTSCALGLYVSPSVVGIGYSTVSVVMPVTFTGNNIGTGNSMVYKYVYLTTRDGPQQHDREHEHDHRRQRGR